MTDRAATLTYFAMMSLFPALLVGVTLLGLVGQQGLVTDATNYLLDHGVDGEHRERRHAGSCRTWSTPRAARSGSPCVVSVLLAPQRRVGRLRRRGSRAERRLRRRGEPRHGAPQAHRPRHGAASSSCSSPSCWPSIFLGGQIADDLFGKIGLGSTAATIWSYVRWPVALVAATVAYGIVYGLAPDIEPRQIRWITPGAVVGVVLWIVLSLGFSIYVRNFSSYGAVYGAFARGDRAAAVALPVGQRVPLRRRAQRRARAQRGPPEPRDSAPELARAELAVGQLRRVGAQARAARAASRTARGAAPRPPGRRRPAAAPRRRAARRRASRASACS